MRFSNIISSFSLAVLLVTQSAEAKLEGLDTTAGEIGFDAPSGLFEIIANYASWLFSFLGLVFFAIMLYGGIIWMTSAGDDKKVAKAKDLLRTAVIGIVIIVSAFAITTFLADNFGPL